MNVFDTSNTFASEVGSFERSWHDSFTNSFNSDGVMKVSLSRSDWLISAGEGVAITSASHSSKYDSNVRSSASSASSIVLYFLFTSIKICCLTAAAVRKRNENELLGFIGETLHALLNRDKTACI